MMMDGNATNDPAAPALLTVCRDGEPVGLFASSLQPSDIDDVNCWSGRSNYTNDGNLQGTFDEIRIYDEALEPAKLLRSFLAAIAERNKETPVILRRTRH